MKSPYKIAKELGVSPQAVYKRMTVEFNNQYADHIKRTQNGKYELDPVAEEFIKGLFNYVQQRDIEPVVQPTIQPLLNQLNIENAFLRERIELLEGELTAERAHSRGQADKITELAENLAKLANNAQQLHGAEIIPRLSGNDSIAEVERPARLQGFWARVFGKNMFEAKRNEASK
jgi:hypothetical protein